jgi:hypothetical protein
MCLKITKYIKVAVRKIRWFTKIYILVIVLASICFIITESNIKTYPDPFKLHAGEFFVKKKLINDDVFQAPFYNSQYIGSVEPLSISNNIPLNHIGYMQQQGPLMIKRTLERTQKYVEIVFDYTLQMKFRNFPQCSNECKFSFSQDYNEIAAFADSFVTDKPKGILVNGWIAYN